MISMKEVLNKNIETLFAVFFNSTQNADGNFEIISSFKKTKFLPCQGNNIYDITAKNLSKKYDLSFNWNKGIKIVALIENDEKINMDDFLNKTYLAIIKKIGTISEKTFNIDIELALAMFSFRGSADFTGNFYTVDARNLTSKYVDNLFKILLSSKDLLSKLNFNFRDFQPQQVSGKHKRETQIRSNLKWFHDNVATKLKSINPYKARTLTENKDKIGLLVETDSFLERIKFYKENVVGKKLTKQEIEKLRQSIKFDKEEEKESRNQKIVTYAKEIFEDKCVGCSDMYNIKDRSFIMKRTGKYYLEINHVISYSSDSKKVDVLDNLVKLCPVCHKALTRNRSTEIIQKKIIKNMLESRKEVEVFIYEMMDKVKYKTPIDFVFDKLR